MTLTSDFVTLDDVLDNKDLTPEDFYDISLDNKIQLLLSYVKKLTGDIHLSEITNNDIKKDIARFSSRLLTGQNESIYSYGLLEKMFTHNYNIQSEWSWVIKDVKSNVFLLEHEDKDIGDKLAALHALFYKYLGRCADYKTIKYFLNNEVPLKKVEQSLTKCAEKSCVNWYKGYLTQSGVYLDRINYVMEKYVELLNYIPSKLDLEYFWLFRKLKSTEFKSLVDNYIKGKSDFKYLEECRDNFRDLSVNTPTISSEDTTKISVKYVGPVGTSGYSKICRDIVKSIYNQDDVDIYFSVSQFQNFDVLKVSSDDEFLSVLSKNTFGNKFDYVIIHSTPELWPAICAKERRENPDVFIYGITVWETEILPYMWDSYIQFVDKLSVPSEFSSIAFRKISNVVVDVVHHPLIMKDMEFDFVSTQVEGKDKCPLNDVGKGKYIFYNISEWTNRKGITELIKVFVKGFKDNSEVLLYIKCFGDIDEETGKNFVKKFEALNIILDYARVNDSYIDCIHSCGHCYVSLCKSEGHGLGACYAALNGKHVIITGYGGQVDYLGKSKDIDYVKYSFEPASFCIPWADKHKYCKYLPHCSYFNAFVPAQQKWAKANLDDCMSKMRTCYLNSKLGSMETRNYIDENFNEREFNGNLMKSLLSTVRKNVSEVHRTVEFLLDNDLSVEDVRPQLLFFDWKNKTKNILCINSHGNGNVGDDSYGFILNEFFKDSKKYNVDIVSDTQVMFSDKSVRSTGGYLAAISKNENEKELCEFDYLIIGGGGLLNKERINRNNSMWIYTDIARKKNIPYYIVSVGFQNIEVNSEKEDFKKFEPFRELLDNADFISVRSVPDYNIACSIVSKHTKEFLYYHPDMVYSIKNFVNKNKNSERNVLMVIINNWIDISKQFIQVDIRKRLNANPDLELVFVDFGGVNYEKDVAINNDLLIQNFSDYDFEVHYGVSPQVELSKLYPKRTCKLIDIYNLMMKTDTVITGRYHGYILGKVFNVPNIETYNYSNFKFEADNVSGEKIFDTALEPLMIIKNYIDNDYKKFTSKTWNSADRNGAIVYLHIKTGIDVSMIQNWSSRKIEEFMRK